MKKIKAVLFDFDGTTLDTHELVYGAYKHSFKVNFNRIITDEEIGAMMGKTLKESYAILAGTDDIANLVREHTEFQLTHIELGVPFKETRKTLKKIKAKGIKIGLVTSRHLATLEESLDHAGLLDFFDVIVHADNVSNHKPHPEPLKKALHMLKIDAKDAVIVGDTDADILAGKNAGVTTIGVTYGFYGQRIREFNPDYVVDDIKDVLLILES